MIARWQTRMDRWIDQRLPVAPRITLDQGRIFIFPTRLALAMGGLIALLFLLGNLFQNTLAYVISFWLIAMIVVSILYTYRNFSGLRLRAAGSEPCFAGERAVFRYRIDRIDGRPGHALELAWRGEDHTRLELPADGSLVAELSHSTVRRGRFEPPRLLLQTRFPLGLIVAWSYLRFDDSTLVYPAPIEAPPIGASDDFDAPDDSPPRPDRREGNGDFDGVRDYRGGDSMRRIHWRKSAQRGELLTKTFEQPASHLQWLDWVALAGDEETRLSQLCAQVLDASDQGLSYGLRLPGTQIGPGSGTRHRDDCLRALALHGGADR